MFKSKRMYQIIRVNVRVQVLGSGSLCQETVSPSVHPSVWLCVIRHFSYDWRNGTYEAWFLAWVVCVIRYLQSILVVAVAWEIICTTCHNLVAAYINTTRYALSQPASHPSIDPSDPTSRIHASQTIVSLKQQASEELCNQLHWQNCFLFYQNKTKQLYLLLKVIF